MRELEGSGYSRSEAQALLEYWLYQPGQAGLQGALSGGVGALTSLTLGRLFGENRAPAGEESWTADIEAGWADEDRPGAGRAGEPESVDISGESGIIDTELQSGIESDFHDPYKGIRKPANDFTGKRGISTLVKHFLDHGEDFECGTSREYYDAATNEFGIINCFGGISTYFKPKTGLAYWVEQVELYAGIEGD